MVTRAHASMFAALVAAILAACGAVQVSTPLEFNSSVWGPQASQVVTVVNHMDLTILDNAAIVMDDGSNVTMFFIVEPIVELIRGACSATHDMASGLPPMSTGQCHMLVTWGHLFVLLRFRSVWIDRLYIEEEQKPSTAASDIFNREGQPSIMFRVRAGARLWLTRTTLVGTTESTALSVGGASVNSIPGKAALSNCTVTRFAAARFWAGTIFSAGHLSIEDTVLSENRIRTTYTAIVDATAPNRGQNTAIIDMRDVRLYNNSAVFDIMRYGDNARVASNDPNHLLTYYNPETDAAASVPFDSLSSNEQALLISTRTQDFQLKVQEHGWEAHESVEPEPTTVVTTRQASGLRPDYAGVVGGIIGALVTAVVGAMAFVIWQRKSKHKVFEQELGYALDNLGDSERQSSTIPAHSTASVTGGMSTWGQGAGGPHYQPVQ